MKKYGNNIISIGIFIVIILAWEFLVPIFNVPKFILPRFSLIIKALIDQKQILLSHAAVTFSESIFGLIISAVIGAMSAYLIYASKIAKKTLYPIIVFSQTIPIIALSPIMVMWFGYTIWSKIAIVILFCFFPITISTLDGLNNIDSDLENVLKSLGATKRQLFLKQYLPSMLPGFLSGFKIAATYSVGGATIGEWLGADKGLGIYIKRVAGMLQSESVFAGVIVLSLLGLLLFLSGLFLEKILLRYRRYDK